MTATFSHFSTLHLPCTLSGKVISPKQAELPLDDEGNIRSVGYVRSESRARHSWLYEQGGWKIGDTIPFRDYPSSVLTETDSYPEERHPEAHIVISCRNVFNEFGYQVRIKGKWLRRFEDEPIDKDWPVLQVSEDGLRIQRLSDVEDLNDDIVTGIPLVRDGISFDRRFFVAHCSDIAHVYELHPKGLLGPSAEAWHTMSNDWQSLRDKGADPQEMFDQLERLASSFHVHQRNDLLHSIIGQTGNGDILCLAIIGPLDYIAKMLVEMWHVRNAIVLDNGGSVGWRYYPNNKKKGTLLVSGPNHRPAGTVFLVVRLGGLLKSELHDIFGNKIRCFT